MKKVYSMVMIIMCAVLLSGCVRYSTTFDIKEDGRADMSMLLAAKDEMADSADQEGRLDSIFGDVEEMKETGWTVEDYSEDGFTGYYMTIEDVDLSDGMQSLTNAGKLKVNNDDGVYTIHWDVMDEDQYDKLMSYKDYLDESDGYMTMVLNLPVEVMECNATDISVDRKTCIWDFTQMERGEAIEAKFDLSDVDASTSGSMEGFFETVGYLMGFVAIIAIIIVTITNNSKKKKMMQYQQPYMGQQPQMGQPMNYRNPQQFNPVNQQNPAAGANTSGRFCPHCGAALTPGSNFCGSCGTKLS